MPVQAHLVCVCRLMMDAFTGSFWVPLQAHVECFCCSLVQAHVS